VDKTRKIIGLMAAWGSEGFVELALKQAVDICDEVLVWVAPHSPDMTKYEDNTYNLANEFKDYFITEREINNWKCKHMEVISGALVGDGKHSTEKANIFNTMLKYNSVYFEKGSWIFTLDVDEFFSQELVEEIYRVIDFDNCNKIELSERFFYINMQHYLFGSHFRLFKIENENQRFIPTQRWDQKVNKIYKTTNLMFHYSMLQNPWMKYDFWQSEYAGTNQKLKTDWLMKIYRSYYLGDEEYWVNKNQELSGLKSPWYAKDFTPNSNGYLHVYNGQHHKLIEESGLTKINDFRKLYNF